MEKNKNPTSAGAYVSVLKPNYFGMLYWEKYSKREIKGEGVAYGSIKSSRGVFGSLASCDIHLLTRNAELNAQQIRALPEFDFDKPELIALQVGHDMDDQNESYSGLADKINKMFIESQLRDTKINADKVLLVESCQGHSSRPPHLIYQMITVPSTKTEVKSLLSIAENFYDESSEREKALNALEELGKTGAKMFVDRLEKNWNLKGQRREWKRGDSVENDGYVMGDVDGGYNPMFTGTYPIAKYADDAIQAVLPKEKSKAIKK